jgi:hypothetical protein
VLLELFGGSGLAAVLQAGIKVKRYIYVDVDDATRQVAKQHARRLRTQFPDLLAYTAIMSSFSTLVGDIALLLVMWTGLLQGGLVRACLWQVNRMACKMTAPHDSMI